MALVVLDASVVIGFLDADDALNRASVRAVAEHQQDELAIPASAYAEILIAPYRSGRRAVAEVDAFLADFAVAVEPLTAPIAHRAARLRSRYRSLRLPDAFVLATADELGAARVLTGDRAWPKISRRATVVR